MVKDYKNWMPIKCKIHNKQHYPILYKEREIWNCNLGENVGFETDGKFKSNYKSFARPVLILKKFSKQSCHVVPLTKNPKADRFHYSFDGKTGIISIAKLSQSRAIDSSRLIHKIGYVKEEDFLEIKNRIKNLLSL